MNEKPLLFRANLDKAIDFLDSIDEDQPKGYYKTSVVYFYTKKKTKYSIGCWSLQFERGSALLLLRNLKWPGAVFFHIPETQSFGFSYNGVGESNKDLAFML